MSLLGSAAGKKTGNDLFDKLDTSKLNQHLKGIMPALTAKVFRTYNASITLDNLVSPRVWIGLIVVPHLTSSSMC